MSETEETPDSHDVGKLVRWHEGLLGGTEVYFPVCALFLASGEDRLAHDIFRSYRSVFEELGAGFHDLIIFGQHGMSTTCTALMPALGLPDLQVPSLVLICRGKKSGLYTANLPEGALANPQEGEDCTRIPWQPALETIRQSVVTGSELILDGLQGLNRADFPRDTLEDIIGEVRRLVESV